MSSVDVDIDIFDHLDDPTRLPPSVSSLTGTRPRINCDELDVFCVRFVEQLCSMWTVSVSAIHDAEEAKGRRGRSKPR